jgi:hypothetical protein
MKFLNLANDLSVENLDDITPLTLILPKNMDKWSLQEIDNFLDTNLNIDLPNKLYLTIDASELKTKIAYNFFFTIVNKVINIITTDEMKFEEKRLGAKDDITSQTTIPLYQLKRLLNYKSKIDYLQVELYRKNKLKISMVE